MSSKSRPVVFRVVLALAVVAGALIAQGLPAVADDTQADLGLSVTATGGQNIAGAAEGVDFVYTVSSTGPSDNVGGFEITDALPAGFGFESAGSSAECE